MSKPDAAGDKPVIRPAARSSAGDIDLWLRMWFFKGEGTLQIGNSLVSAKIFAAKIMRLFKVLQRLNRRAAL